MNENKVLNYIENVLENSPKDWLNLTTHRLDIYDESSAKTEFLDQFENLFKSNNYETAALSKLPTAYDYIRLGHPLSSILEWTIARLNNLKADNVISFSSRSIPVLAILRKNLFRQKNTRIIYQGQLPDYLDAVVLKRVYGYRFDLMQVDSIEEISGFDGSTIFISENNELGTINFPSHVDFLVNIHDSLGSIIAVNGNENESYISEIQHVRRRETIAMTPADCYTALQRLTGKPPVREKSNAETTKTKVVELI